MYINLLLLYYMSSFYEEVILYDTKVIFMKINILSIDRLNNKSLHT